MSLFVDDGEPARGHRWNMLATDYKMTGLAFCINRHVDVKFMTNLLYAQSFKIDQRGLGKLKSTVRRERAAKREPTVVILPPQGQGVFKREVKQVNSAWTADPLPVITRRKRPQKPILKKIEPAVRPQPIRVERTNPVPSSVQ